jgi:hypothetical protein
VKIIVGQAAGSASDIVARLIAQFLSEKLGQQFLVEVRPGAAGNIREALITRFLANWEVESDIILPQQIPFVRHEHPAGTYTVFLRNPRLAAASGCRCRRLFYASRAGASTWRTSAAGPSADTSHICLAERRLREASMANAAQLTIATFVIHGCMLHLFQRAIEKFRSRLAWIYKSTSARRSVLDWMCR